jgi:hypothetical protein
MMMYVLVLFTYFNQYHIKKYNHDFIISKVLSLHTST